MITEKEWDKIYTNTIKWVVRRMDEDALEFYNDKAEDWVDAIQALGHFEKRMADNFDDKKQSFTFSYDDWFGFCHQFIKEAKEKHQRRVAELIFTIWQTGRACFDSFAERCKLGDYRDYARPINQIELAKVKTLVPDRVFDENTSVVNYRGAKIAMCKDITDLGYMIKDDVAIAFTLEWDWWFPIDHYLDLTEGW